MAVVVVAVVMVEMSFGGCSGHRSRLLLMVVPFFRFFFAWFPFQKMKVSKILNF
jgi:hypothetical protein